MGTGKGTREQTKAYLLSAFGLASLFTQGSRHPKEAGGLSLLLLPWRKVLPGELILGHVARLVGLDAISCTFLTLKDWGAKTLQRLSELRLFGHPPGACVFSWVTGPGMHSWAEDIRSLFRGLSGSGFHARGVSGINKIA